MHEVSIVESALERAFEILEQEGASRVIMLRMRVGALSDVVPQALELAWEALTPGTRAEGAQLEIERVEVHCVCRGCGQAFTPPDVIFVCPGCGEISATMAQGRELEIATMEIEKDC